MRGRERGEEDRKADREEPAPQPGHRGVERHAAVGQTEDFPQREHEDAGPRRRRPGGAERSRGRHRPLVMARPISRSPGEEAQGRRWRRFHEGHSGWSGTARSTRSAGGQSTPPARSACPAEDGEDVAEPSWPGLGIAAFGAPPDAPRITVDRLAVLTGGAGRAPLILRPPPRAQSRDGAPAAAGRGCRRPRRRTTARLIEALE
jgi:hypothetical protein